MTQEQIADICQLRLCADALEAQGNRPASVAALKEFGRRMNALVPGWHYLDVCRLLTPAWERQRRAA